MTEPVMPFVYRVRIPSLPLININDSKRMHRRVRGPMVSALRAAAREAVLGFPFMDRASVTCYVTRKVSGPKERWDAANWYPSAKACVDGFTDAGLWEDDSVLHVIGPDMRGRVGVKAPPHGSLDFMIIDLSRGGGDDG